MEKERNKFIEETSKDYQSNPKLAQLVRQHASVSSVDVESNIDRTIFRKKREYSENKFYEGVYSQEQDLLKVKDEAGFNAIKNNLNALFQSGLQSGIIDQKAIISLKDRQGRLIEERRKELELDQRAVDALKQNYHLDPNNSDDRKVGDALFARVTSLASQKGQNVEEVAASFVSKQGYVPARMKQVWSGYLNSGTPEQKMAIASSMIDLAESHPHLQGQFNSSDYAYAKEIQNRTDIGIPPSKAVEYADKAISDYKSLDTQAKIKLFNNKDSQKLRDSSYNDAIKFLSDEKGIDFYKPTPAVKEKLKEQFEQNVKDIMLNTDGVTHDSAISLAAQQLRKEYAVTNIGERRLQRFSPEAMYSKYGNTDWIDGQFKSKVIESVLYPSEKAAEKDLKNYNLIPDLSTIDGKVSYLISKKDDSGKLDYLRDSNNQPVRFTPDFTKTEVYQKAKRAQEKRLGIVPESEALKQIEADVANPRQLSKSIIVGSSRGKV